MLTLINQFLSQTSPLHVLDVQAQGSKWGLKGCLCPLFLQKGAETEGRKEHTLFFIRREFSLTSLLKASVCF